MSEHHSTNGRPERAGILLRNSDDRQENSPDRQRSLCQPHCARKGYQVVAEYLDFGVAGDCFEFHKRVAFQKMLRDAREHQIDVLVYDEPERLSRQDTIEFIALVIYPLRETGIRLETVAEGPISWDDLIGILMLAIRQDKASSECPKLARRVLSGYLLRAKNAIDTGGPPPYGYTWAPDPIRGKRLVIVDEQARVVRLIYSLAERGYTLGAIRLELRQRGILSPSGRPLWAKTVIRKVLKNRKYLGDAVYGVQAQGKHVRQAKGELRKRRPGECRYAQNPEEDWVITPNSHEAIIQRDQWERVGDAQKSNQGRTTPHVGGGIFVLNKMLVCSHCGCHLLGAMNGRKPTYVCGSYIRYGKAVCNNNSVRQEVMLDILLTVLQRQFLNPERLDELRAEARRQEEAEKDPGAIKVLRTAWADLEGKIAQANVNLAILPADRLPGVIATVRGWEQDRDRLAAELERLTKTSLVESLDAQIKQIESLLWRLREVIGEADPAEVRSMLRDLVARVELRFEHKQTAKYMRSKLVGGTIYLTWGEAESLNLNPGTTHSEQVRGIPVDFTIDA